MSEQFTPDHDPNDSKPGVSVKIEDRFYAINSLADIYAKYARARGLKKRLGDKREHPGLANEFGNLSEARRIGRRALEKAQAEHREHVPRLTERLMKTSELADGFDRTDVEDGADREIKRLKHKHIGVDVGDEERQRFLDGLNSGAPQD